MKKITILFVSASLALGTFTACKSKTAEAPVEASTPAVETPAPAAAETPVAASEVVSAINVPTFSDAAVTAFCGEYKTLMTEYAALKGSGDQAKATELEKKFMGWAEKAAGLAGKIKPEEMKQFNDFMMEAQKNFETMSTASAK